MPVEVLDVVFARRDQKALWGSHIDLPKPGALVDGERLAVVGWVLGKEAPAVAVELLSGARLLTSVPVDQRRPDLGAAFPQVDNAERGGFRATALLGAAIDLDLELRAVLEGGERVGIGAVRAKRRWPEHGEAAVPALVSVIVTAQNRADELLDAIHSVLAQTYPHFELVIVDAGSTDQTAEIVRRTPGARLIHIEEPGTAEARNAGLAATSGSFVVFMDATDRLLPDALEIGLKELAAHPDCAFVSGIARVIAESDTEANPQQPFVPHDHYTTLLQGNYILNQATVMYRRPVLGEVGVFDPELPRLSEYDLYLRIARQYPVATHTARVVEDHTFAHRAESAAESLAAGLDILSRQEPFVAGDPRREQAFGLAKRRWQAQWSAHVDAPSTTTVPKRSFGLLRRRHPPAEAEPPTRRPVGKVTLGDLHGLLPVNDNFGFGRGQPVDRYYIERFLERRRAAIRGRVLEVQDDSYTVRYGAEGVTQSEVINLLPGNTRATIIGDLVDPAALPQNAFDCVILTQTLHLIYAAPAALRNVYASLRDGGTLLLTTPGISQVEWREAWYWLFTSLSLKRMLEDVFGPSNVDLESNGNVLAATAFLQGLAVEDLARDALDYVDLHYPVILTAHATKR